MMRRRDSTRNYTEDNYYDYKNYRSSERKKERRIVSVSELVHETEMSESISEYGYSSTK